MNLLEINHMKKSFGDLEVIKDFSLTVKEGEVVSIIGPSGSGKSTILRCATLLEQMDDGELSISLRKRLLRSHMSLRRLNDALRANDLSKTRSIVLIHLSDHRSDEEEMVRSVQVTTGIENVCAAAAGMTIPLEINPF